ncbi:MAG: hypothetical protein JSR99_03490 [Proteobacteria bacterium]|nr:hypothetical protein [Pseudomonadota bacterium]
MPSHDLDELEVDLRDLGRMELALEENIRILFARGRELVSSGQMERSEEVWRRHDESRTALRELKIRIYAVEDRLYRLRRG